MSTSIIIVESPNKAKTIRQILGKEYEVLATVGHFRDLPQRELGVDVEREFEPTYVVQPDKQEVALRLKSVKERYSPEKIFIASDADREGEAIAWHIAETIGLEIDQVQRMEFHEITPEGLKRALGAIRPLDMDLVFAQQARRILDRLVGYKVSPIVQGRIPEEKQLSAGRVQSVALRIVVDREIVIRAFLPEESFSVHAHYEGFEAELALKAKNGLKERSEAEAIAEKLRGEKHRVDEIKSKQTKRNPPAPLITSTMLQLASSQLKMDTDQTTKSAKTLFEAGLVTYIRTDDPSVSPEFQQETLVFLKNRYGKEVVPAKANIHKAKSANAQGAHECIRPPSLEEFPPALTSLDTGAQQLYRLITRVFLASQCLPALFDATEVKLSAGEFKLKASGRVMKFKGYLNILDDRDSKEKELPKLEVGQEPEMLKAEVKQHWTKPPDRFTDATLIKYLEEKGIGRPSTFASMVSLIFRKSFVEKVDRKHLAPTTRGERLDAELRKGFGSVINEGFTKQLEEELDRIAASKLAWRDFMGTFWLDFEPLVGTIPCPFCGGPTRRVVSQKNQKEYLCCSKGREECGFIMEATDMINPKCPICGAPTRRFPSGKGFGCVRWRRDGVNSCRGIVEEK